jgi:hypothetical protein
MHIAAVAILVSSFIPAVWLMVHDVIPRLLREFRQWSQRSIRRRERNRERRSRGAL